MRGFTSIFVGLWLALIGLTPSFAQVSPPSAPADVSGTKNAAGFDLFLKLPVNDSTQAYNNWLSITNALNSRYHVILECNGSIYISSTIYLKTGAQFDVRKGCGLTGTFGTGTLVANWASSPVNVPWTVTQNNTSAAGGPASILWPGVFVTYSNNLAVTQGQLITNSSGVFEVSVAGTTAATGTGPTPTTLTDGTATFVYATANNAAPYNGGLNVAVYWPSHGLSVGQAVWIQPEPDTYAPRAWTTGTAYLVYQVVSSNSNLYYATTAGTAGATAPSGTGSPNDGGVNWTYLGPVGSPPMFYSGVEPAGIAGAAMDPAYTGVFTVTNATDPNWVWVQLGDQPAAGASYAPMMIKLADSNVSFGGDGALNYNNGVNGIYNGTYTVNGNTYSTLSSANTTSMLTVWAGIKDFKITGFSCANVQKYCADFNGAANGVIENIRGVCGQVTSDLIKNYGYAADLWFKNATGCSGDDFISEQPEELAPFSVYALGYGNIRRMHFEHIKSDSTLAITIYKNENAFVLDDLYFDDIKVINSLTGAQRNPFAFYNQAPSALTTPVIGNIRIRGPQAVMAYQAFIGCGGGNLTIQNLVVDDFVANPNINPAINPNYTGGLLYCGQANFTFNQVVINNPKVTFGNLDLDSNSDALIRLPNATTVIKNLAVYNPILSSPTPSTTNYGYIAYMNSGGGTINRLLVQGGTLTSMNGIGRFWTTTDVTLNNVQLTNNSGGSMQGVGVNAANIRIHACANTLSNINLGLVRVNTNVNFQFFSCGDNYLSGASYIYQAPTVPTTASLFNVVDQGRQGNGTSANGVPTVNSCGSGSSLSATSDSFAGQVTIPSGTTTCTYNVPSNAWPVAPRSVQCTPLGTTQITVTCAATFTTLGASTNNLTITLSANAAGETVSYLIQ